MNGSTFGVRWWRLRHLGRNPLVRAGDRLESVALLAAVLIVLLALPFAGLLGSETYAGQSQEAQVQAATRHSVTATLLEDAPEEVTSARGTVAGGTANVVAAWTLRNGTPVTGTVVADKGSTAGSEVEIWLDQDGAVVSPPLRSDIVMANAIGVAAFAWFGVVALSAIGFSLVRWAFNRARYARWERDWERVRADWSLS